MKRKILITAVMSMLLALSQTAFGKGHVPGGKAQICAGGDVAQVSDKVLGAFANANNSSNVCILPVCDFNNVFQTGEGNCAGLSDGDGDGLCDLPNARDQAGTPGCPAGRF